MIPVVLTFVLVTSLNYSSVDKYRPTVVYHIEIFGQRRGSDNCSILLNYKRSSIHPSANSTSCSTNDCQRYRLLYPIPLITSNDGNSSHGKLYN